MLPVSTLKTAAMIKHLFKKRINNNNWIFSNNYIDAKALFLYKFDEIPSISYITGIDINKAYSYLRDTEKNRLHTFQHSEYSHEENKLLFNVTFIVLEDRKIIEVGGEYVSVLHTQSDYNWASNLLNTLSGFKLDKSTDTNGKIGFATQQVMN